MDDATIAKLRKWKDLVSEDVLSQDDFERVKENLLRDRGLLPPAIPNAQPALPQAQAINVQVTFPPMQFQSHGIMSTAAIIEHCSCTVRPSLLHCTPPLTWLLHLSAQAAVIGQLHDCLA